MTPAEKRIAIAVYCGWNPETEVSDDKMGYGFSGIFPKWWHISQLPDYWNDLNAIQFAVTFQRDAFRDEFEDELRRAPFVCLLIARDWADIFLVVKQRQNKNKGTK